jgi:hypothetical protein
MITWARDPLGPTPIERDPVGPFGPESRSVAQVVKAIGSGARVRREGRGAEETGQDAKGAVSKVEGILCMCVIVPLCS